MLYTQAIHKGTPCTGSLYYTAQHVYYYVYIGPHAHSTIHTTLCTYIHLLDTYTMHDVYTHIHYTVYRDTYTHTIHVYYWIIIK